MYDSLGLVIAIILDFSRKINLLIVKALIITAADDNFRVSNLEY